MKKRFESWAERYLTYLNGISIKDLYFTTPEQTGQLYDAAFAEMLMDAGLIDYA